MEKKNIWIVNQHSYPPGYSNWTRHFDLFNKLEEYDIDIIGGSYVHDRKKQIPFEINKVEIKNIKYHILKGISYKKSVVRILAMIEFMFKAIFYSKKIENKPDIIYSSSPHPFNCLAGIYLARKYKCKHIVEIRDVWPETWVDMGAMTKKNIIYKFFAFLEKYIYQKADFIVTLTASKDHYIELGIPENKIEIICNGVDVETFDYNLKNFNSFDLPKDKFNITYTGSIGIANALDVIVDAANLLKENKEIHFNFIGEGELKEELIRKVKDLSLTNVSFYDSVEKKYIPSILSKSDLLVLPLKDVELYKKNGISPNKLFEYFCSSKPILLSGYPRNNMILEANCGYTIEPENKELFVEYILKLFLTSVSEKEKFGKNGREYIEKNYDFKVLAKNLKDIIERV